MNKLQIFNYGGNEVRTIEQNGEPWFVLKDVCGVLELTHPQDVAARLDEDERDSIAVTDSLGREQQTTIVNESGLYNVILRSDKPQAKPFRKWVTAEVLPSIRKTGSYAVKPSCIEDILIQSLQEMKAQKAAIAAVNQRVDNIQSVVALDSTAWREDARHLIAKIARAWGGNDYIRDVNSTIYDLVDRRGGVSLATRLTYKRQRMADEGVCKSKRESLTKVDVIADDKKLVEIYLAIVKEMAVKYGVPAAVQNHATN